MKDKDSLFPSLLTILRDGHTAQDRVCNPRLHQQNPVLSTKVLSTLTGWLYGETIAVLLNGAGLALSNHTCAMSTTSLHINMYLKEEQEENEQINKRTEN